MSRTAAAVVATIVIIVTNAVLVQASEEDDFRYVVSGSWTIRRTIDAASLSEETYSWGTDISVRNGSIDIDLLADEPWLQLGYLGGVFPIRAVERVTEESYLITFWFARGGFEVVWRATFVDVNTLYFEHLSGDLTITGIFGPENLHHRIAGPGFSRTESDDG